jgi:hypothetical protein
MIWLLPLHSIYIIVYTQNAAIKHGNGTSTITCRAVGHVILAEVNLVINQRTERQSAIYIYINNTSTYLLVISAINPFFCWLMSYESTFLLVISTINPHICWLISYESSHLLVISTINPHICWLDPHVYRLTGSNCGTAGVCGLAGRLPVAADQILCDGWAFSVQTLVNRRFWDFMSH